jgi:prophage regulatory protein
VQQRAQPRGVPRFDSCATANTIGRCEPVATVAQSVSGGASVPTSTWTLASLGVILPCVTRGSGTPMTETTISGIRNPDVPDQPASTWTYRPRALDTRVATTGDSTVMPETPSTPNHSSPEILREREVLRRTGLSRTTRWRLARKGQFPAPRQISPGAIGWLSYEIDMWVEGRSVTSAMATIAEPEPSPSAPFSSARLTYVALWRRTPDAATVSGQRR